MKIQADQLIRELSSLTLSHIQVVENLKTKTPAELNHKTAPERWSALECIEHLNRYGAYYLPEIESQILNTDAVSESTFKSGIIGNYFTNLIKPKEKLNKMKSPKEMNPLNSKLDTTTLDTFLQQLNHTISLLEQSNKISLNQTKIPVSIFRYIKLKLGDTFRFCIYHNERHIQQAVRAVNTV
ncbi:DinB family protein [Elizabethkingia meningoseptica]|uniref:DinB family protein n=1 Tax=Elizabethkingia meningoseptica TaxID=238 RepID=UPI0023B07881|nr:DinB family protein [Elizabethkingia meningoseptica]MDE5438698.1 DinB family protein [Elizabethkingia meningoseptica]MDE5507833.1 DinB family protein [Elizabethkingia meningoseptica]MDE5516323.1 DinB family protein [Elizabethkingia meningoseptica]MDE5526564.1 DinB family protein [Elizabethkingia meningoseptica]MDE5530632.1 DinB family protein [Elizabethkingia meningoseptica]